MEDVESDSLLDESSVIERLLEKSSVIERLLEESSEIERFLELLEGPSVIERFLELWGGSFVIIRLSEVTLELWTSCFSRLRLFSRFLVAFITFVKKKSLVTIKHRKYF